MGIDRRCISDAPYLQVYINFVGLFWEFLKKGRSCRFYASLDVYLNKNNVIQPDVFIICDKSKISKRGCEGIPDLVVEILSIKTKQNDLPGGSKFKLYEQFGLKEYWIVDPLDENNITLTQFTLENNILTQKRVYTKEDKFQSFLFPQLEVDLSEVFNFE